MKVSTEALIAELQALTTVHQSQVKELMEMSDAELTVRPKPGTWNVLECVEHLNRYSRFYLPEIAVRLAAAPRVYRPHFKSSWLGNYFAESMKPGKKKMNTFKEMNPLEATLNRKLLEEFEEQLREMQSLLYQAKDHDLSKIKTAISISKLIRLRLGDTLRVVIYHNDRHLLQARKIHRPAKLGSMVI